MLCWIDWHRSSHRMILIKPLAAVLRPSAATPPPKYLYLSLATSLPMKVLQIWGHQVTYKYDINGLKVKNMVSQMADVVPSHPRLKLHTTIGKIPEKLTKAMEKLIVARCLQNLCVYDNLSVNIWKYKCSMSIPKKVPWSPNKLDRLYITSSSSWSILSSQILWSRHIISVSTTLQSTPNLCDGISRCVLRRTASIFLLLRERFGRHAKDLAASWNPSSSQFCLFEGEVQSSERCLHCKEFHRSRTHRQRQPQDQHLLSPPPSPNIKHDPKAHAAIPPATAVKMSKGHKGSSCGKGQKTCVLPARLQFAKVFCCTLPSHSAMVFPSSVSQIAQYGTFPFLRIDLQNLSISRKRHHLCSVVFAPSYNDRTVLHLNTSFNSNHS